MLDCAPCMHTDAAGVDVGHHGVHRHPDQVFELFRDEAWSLGGIALLYAPQWARDRTIHQLPPIEPPKKELAPPLTGAELAVWRKREGLSQVAAAKQLGVSERSIRRAETAPAAAMGLSLAKAFAKLAAKPVEPVEPK